MIVMKFGGASTHTASGVHLVVESILKHRDRHPLIVVSAIGKTTRAIEHAAQCAKEGNRSAATVACEEIFEMHRRLANAVLGAKLSEQACNQIDAIGVRLSALVEGVSIVRELSLRTLDACLGLGEHLASVILIEAIRAAGAEVREELAESIMITDAAYGHAAPRIATVQSQANALIAPALAHDTIVLTQGYVGATEDGTPTTMGMESSDFTATLLGAALAVEEVQIWTNVDGMMTVDPRLYEHARTIPALTYDEAEELAALGAKVLHPRTIGPARDSRIPITVRNASKPEGRLTRIHDKGDVHRGIKGIAVVDGLATMRNEKPRAAEFLFSLGTARHTIHWYGSGAALNGGGAVGAISLVGNGVGRDAALLRSAMETLSPFTIHGICFGASSLSMSVIVPTAAVQEAVEILHKRFIDRAV